MCVWDTQAGFTEFMTALVNNRLVYLPMQMVVDKSPRKIRAWGRTIERLLASTGQPQDLGPKPAKKKQNPLQQQDHHGSALAAVAAAAAAAAAGGGGAPKL